jgi:hypothetical protein
MYETSAGCGFGCPRLRVKREMGKRLESRRQIGERAHAQFGRLQRGRSGRATRAFGVGIARRHCDPGRTGETGAGHRDTHAVLSFGGAAVRRDRSIAGRAGAQHAHPDARPGQFSGHLARRLGGVPPGRIGSDPTDSDLNRAGGVRCRTAGPRTGARLPFALCANTRTLRLRRACRGVQAGFRAGDPRDRRAFAAGRKGLRRRTLGQARAADAGPTKDFLRPVSPRDGTVRAAPRIRTRRSARRRQRTRKP